MYKNSEQRVGRINKACRRDISEKEYISWESNIARDKTLLKAEQRNRKLGPTPSTIICKGSKDRISAILYNDSKYEKVTDQEAYKEGFFMHGNQELSGKLAFLTKEELEEIGKNDYLSCVNFKGLPEKVRVNQNYLKGYLEAALLQKSGRSR